MLTERQIPTETYNPPLSGRGLISEQLLDLGGWYLKTGPFTLAARKSEVPPRASVVLCYPAHFLPAG